ncbi:conserved hypothetical protein [Roseovarius sp. EC-HK134]|uniref:type I secretion protein n=1 Tax=unclassified Roseovarius TaxID=2614913 RepID=UPI0012582AD9|nr:MULTISPECIES: type I secretion protein [unclassified Roseovarius]VVT26380.1 conserved hypothetical protein [Roseovarius sp. EC-HK134]VVT26490.1 conserved hypothetical protein [Roseovarius sp. EC-SD190]
MPFTISAGYLSDTTFTQAHFGGNALALRDRVGDEGTYDDVARTLGVEHIRYPGGSLTEYYFDIRNPDNDVVVNSETGEATSFLPISDALGFAEEEGIAVTIVLPTRHFLSTEVDAEGNRLPDIDEPALRSFLQDVFDGRYGAADIQAIEIGNEYWGSGGMNTFEYGRLASEMAVIVKDEIRSHPDAEHLSETDILVQMGTNYGRFALSNLFSGTGEDQLAELNETYDLNLSENEYIYSSGDVAWAKVANAIILNEFDTVAEQSAIDGVVAHIYSKGADTPNSRYFELSQIADTWLKEMPGLDIYATEWNLKRSVSEDPQEEFGLKQAHEMLNVLEAFSWGGVDAAHVWPLQMNSRTGLADGEGDADIRVPGEMFRLLNETLPGTRPLGLAGSEGRETELSGETADVHVFYAPDRLVTFLASTSDQPSEEVVDFMSILRDLGDVTITRLGVAEGENPSESTAEPVVTNENPQDLIEDGILIADLAPYEILMIEMLNPVFTAELARMVADTPEETDEIDVEESDNQVVDNVLNFADFFQSGSSGSGSSESLIPTTPPAEEPEDAPDSAAAAGDADDSGGGGGDFGFGALALAFLPILLLAA